MNVLMVGVDKNRVGGMWTVAETYINDRDYNTAVNMKYIATSTCGSKIKRTAIMLIGYIKIVMTLMFGKIDIIHIHMAERGSTFRKGVVVSIGKVFKKTVVVQLHAGPFIDWYLGGSSQSQKHIKRILNKADKILVLGEYWKRQLNKIVDSDKIAVLYNGSNCPKENPYNADGRYILYLGLLKRTKGIYDLLNAMEYIKNKIDDKFLLYLCGSDEEGDIAKIISEKHLENKVQMLGWINTEKRLELFKDTIICVLPSYFEALSMTVIESMCYGIPIVTTNISTMPELVGKEIPLINPGDYKSLGLLIAELLSDKDKRITCSVGLHNRALQKFSIQQNIENTLMFYQECIDRY